MRKRANVTAISTACLMLWSVGCNARTREIGRFFRNVLLVGSVVMTLLGLLALYSAIRNRPSRAPGRELSCALSSVGAAFVLCLPSFFMVDLGLMDAEGGTSVWLIVFDIAAGCFLLFIVFMVVWSLVAWVRRLTGSNSPPGP